jgi:hypothetical protein
VVEIPLAKVGLMTVEDAAAYIGRSVRGVQKFIAGGLLPAVVAGAGKSGHRKVYLLRKVDLDGFTPPLMGRPPKKRKKGGAG